MKVNKVFYFFLVGFSLLILLQIGIIFKESYSKNGGIYFIKESPAPISFAAEIPLKSSKVNINTDSIAVLESLPAVGKLTAQKIVDNRPYKNLEDFKTNSGITNSTFENISNLITL